MELKTGTRVISIECPHKNLRYVGGAPFPAWIKEHDEKCFKIAGEWRMAVSVQPNKVNV